jgi:uncharacterized membrane protein
MAQVLLFRSFAFLVFSLGGLLVFSSASAQVQTGWSVCNETSYVIQVASGRPEGGGTVVQGWTRVRPGGCETLIDQTLTPGVHYLYAESSKAHRGGLKSWKGDEPLCVEGLVSFMIETLADCDAMGLDVRLFRPVLIESRTRWSTTIKETQPYSLTASTPNAQAAGLQRLLNDAGIYNGAVDGDLGARTRGAIREFLRERNLPAETSDADLVDILEQVALDRARNIGMTLCNRTEKRIWSAIGVRNGDGWESRGWWQLEAGGCARVIDEPLLQTEHFVFGEMEGEEGEGKRLLVRGTDTFCIARSKFVISGRENCGVSAYKPALFASTSVPVDRKLIFEFFERDFGQADAP